LNSKANQMNPLPALSAVSSHIGKIRPSNQDSGSIKQNLYVVADGMGGHAGGDVASALAVQHLSNLDGSYASVEEAREALFHSVLEAGIKLTQAVEQHPELTGMGTTLSAMIQIESTMVIAHIGDSRIYRLREGVLEQITTDHTFVQRLVDSGRITPEEASVHPRRSVLMRVLGDVDAEPEIDTHLVDTLPGDRWLLCSDGLSSYVSEIDIAETLLTVDDANLACQKLIAQSLSEGAPDNVTVAVVRVTDKSGYPSKTQAQLVGAAGKPLTFESIPERKKPALPTILLHPLRSVPVADEHFEPEAEYLNELIKEDRSRRIRRRIIWLVSLVAIIGAMFGTGLSVYEWTQSRFFIGEINGKVAIYQGVPENIGPVSLSDVYQQTQLPVSSLKPFEQERVRRTIPAESLSDAEEIIARLRR